MTGFVICVSFVRVAAFVVVFVVVVVLKAFDRGSRFHHEKLHRPKRQTSFLDHE